eukprot:gene4583-5722_t
MEKIEELLDSIKSVQNDNNFKDWIKILDKVQKLLNNYSRSNSLTSSKISIIECNIRLNIGYSVYFIETHTFEKAKVHLDKSNNYLNEFIQETKPQLIRKTTPNNINNNNNNSPLSKILVPPTNSNNSNNSENNENYKIFQYKISQYRYEITKETGRLYLIKYQNVKNIENNSEIDFPDPEYELDFLLEESVRSYIRCTNIAKKLFEENKKNPDRIIQYGESLQTLAQVYYKQKKYYHTLDLCKKVENMYNQFNKDNGGGSSQSLEIPYFYMAKSSLHMYKYEESFGYFQRVLEQQIRMENKKNQLETLNRMFYAYFKAREYTKCKDIIIDILTLDISTEEYISKNEKTLRIVEESKDKYESELLILAKMEKQYSFSKNQNEIQPIIQQIRDIINALIREKQYGPDLVMELIELYEKAETILNSLERNSKSLSKEDQNTIMELKSRVYWNLFVFYGLENNGKQKISYKEKYKTMFKVLKKKLMEFKEEESKKTSKNSQEEDDELRMSQELSFLNVSNDDQSIVVSTFFEEKPQTTTVEKKDKLAELISKKHEKDQKLKDIEVPVSVESITLKRELNKNDELKSKSPPHKKTRSNSVFQSQYDQKIDQLTGQEIYFNKDTGKPLKSYSNNFVVDDIGKSDIIDISDDDNDNNNNNKSIPTITTTSSTTRSTKKVLNQPSKKQSQISKLLVLQSQHNQRNYLNADLYLDQKKNSLEDEVHPPDHYGSDGKLLPCYSDDFVVDDNDEYDEDEEDEEEEEVDRVQKRRSKDNGLIQDYGSNPILLNPNPSSTSKKDALLKYKSNVRSTKQKSSTTTNTSITHQPVPIITKSSLFSPSKTTTTTTTTTTITSPLKSKQVKEKPNQEIGSSIESLEFRKIEIFNQLQLYIPIPLKQHPNLTIQWLIHQGEIMIKQLFGEYYKILNLKKIFANPTQNSILDPSDLIKKHMDSTIIMASFLESIEKKNEIIDTFKVIPPNIKELIGSFKMDRLGIDILDVNTQYLLKTFNDDSADSIISLDLSTIPFGEYSTMELLHTFGRLPNLRFLNLSSCETGFLKLIRTKVLERLDKLEMRGIGLDKINEDCIKQIFSRCKSLQSISLGHNQINQPSIMKIISESLMISNDIDDNNNNSILSDNNIIEPKCRFKEFELDSMNLDSQCSKYLSVLFLSCPTLVVLDLHSNRLGFEGAKSISTILQICRFLSNINLSDCELSTNDQKLYEISDKLKNAVTIDLSGNQLSNHNIVDIISTQWSSLKPMPTIDSLNDLIIFEETSFFE